MLEDLIRRNRSCRRFFENEAIPMETLKWLVNLARLSASAGNLQPLRYILSNQPRKNEAIFSCLAWAGYLPDWPGPPAGERPAAYVVVVGDKSRAATLATDVGIAAQSILLGAREKGLGGCMIGSIKRDQLRESLKIPDGFEIVLVIALGKPKETVVLEEVGAAGDIKYWRDEQGVHHVPKRPLKDLILSE
ncbi:MAG: nitroreductase family protein [Syntrophobacterales bacterium]|jgi:nitroreductase|nr:nitroreductase family protein [Syntrophobacterales bacterium]